MGLQGQVALVTGSGARVGRQIALRLAEAGMAIAAHYHTSRSGAASLVEAVRSRGGVARAYGVDLGEADGVEHLASAALRDFGGIDLLVNSAAAWPRTPVASLTPGDFDRVLAIDLRAPFLLSVRIGRAMKEKGRGQIINLLDWSLERPYPDYLPYGIAKAGLAAATRGLARALAPEVRVNAVAPGPVLLPEGMEAERSERIRRAIPLGRIGKADDVADAILYLIQASYATGSILTIDGGRSLR